MSDEILGEFLERPDDDELAFVHYEQQFRRQMENAVKDSEESSVYNHFVQSYINHVLAVARALDLQILNNWLHQPQQAGLQQNFRQVRFDIDGTVTEIKVRHAIMHRKLSVRLEKHLKEKVWEFVGKIKQVLEGGNIPVDRRERLMDKLNAFGKELDRTRTPMSAFADLAIEAADAAGEVEGKLRPIKGWIDSIAGLFREARVSEELRPMLPAPPRRIATHKAHATKAPSWDPPPKSDLDDEIPF